MHDQDELIERKIDGTLTPEEAHQFDRLLRSDPAFAQAYATQREMIALFRQHQKEVLHEQLKAGYQVYRTKRASKRYYYGVAATLLLVLLGGWFWWFSSNESLFAKYYQPYEATISRGNASISENQAVTYYSQEQYAKAVPLLRDLKQTNNDSDYWTLLLGNAYLQIDSISQAITQFEQAANSQNPVYQQYGGWYTALSYLKAKEMARARLVLQPIAEQPGLFKQKAQQVLREL